MNMAASWDIDKKCDPAVEYYQKRGKCQEKLLRQNLFNIIAIPPENRNCDIYELISLGQRILRQVYGIEEKHELATKLFSIRKDFNFFRFVKNKEKVYESVEIILLNAIVLAGIYTLHFAPERVLRHDWVIKPPFIRPAAAFEKANLNPYMAVALLSRLYTEEMKYAPKE